MTWREVACKVLAALILAAVAYGPVWLVAEVHP